MTSPDTTSANLPAETTSHSEERGSGSTATSRVGRNTIINFFGAVVPIFVSLATVPAYLHLIGNARYGVLAVIWVVFGYFGVFEFGLSRATANQIARMRYKPAEDRARLFWTALLLNAGVGAVGGALLFLVGHLVLGHVLKVSPEFRSQATAAVPWLAAGVPATTITTVLAGTLEGRERFLTANLLTVIGIALFQLVPLGYAYWVGPNLTGLIMSAIIALLASTALSLVVTALSLPATGFPSPDRTKVGMLFRYGGWITVSGLVGPLLTVVDRVLIGAFLGARSVTLYTVPFTLVSRAQILSGSLARTLFPRFSVLEAGEAAVVGREALRVLTAVITPITVIGAVLLEPFLRIWVGGAITRDAAPVGEILLLGMWLNSLAVIPYGFLQARGRPDLTAKFHLLELLPYAGALVLGLHLAGIRGAAWAWTARAGSDAALLFWAAARISGTPGSTGARQLLRAGILVGVACFGNLIPLSGSLKVGLGGGLVALSIWWGWRSARMRLRPLATRP